MPDQKCLNCNQSIDNKFCPNCGQKTSTHGFSWKYLLINDFINGALKFDKGFFYTIKELFLRPGHSIREYIAGKRVDHFNYFSLLLVILAVNHFIGSYSSVSTQELYRDNNIKGYLKLAREYNAIVRMLNIPLWSLVTFLLFRKSEQNYIENIVMNMYMMCGVLVVYPLVSLFAVFYNNVAILKIINNGVSLYTIVYFFYFLYQYYSVYYSKRIFLFLRCFLAVLLLVFAQSSIVRIINKVGELFF